MVLMPSDNPHRQNCYCDVCRNNHPFEIPDDLYKDLVKGNVVIFAGAGVSTESSQVFPSKLIDEVRKELGTDSTQGLFPDVMSLYCAKPNGRARLLRKIRDRFGYVQSFPQLHRMATSFQRELAFIPFIENIVTTNWDTYFEQECGAVPFVTAEDYAFAEIPGRKVFKIHGSVDSYGSLVVTREDYEKCYESLRSGLLGSTLRLFLATKTIVYVGFSLTDDDFTRVFEALTSEMHGLRPHSYVVTISRDDRNPLLKKGISPIYTDGTFFILKLKERLVADGHMLGDDRFVGVAELLERVRQIHKGEMSSIDNRKFPDNIFGLCYQDGLIDCLERMLTLARTGEYSRRESIAKIGHKYEFHIRPEKLARAKYHDVAYIDGYLNGLFYLLLDDHLRKAVPIFYVYGKTDPVSSLSQYKRAIKKSSSGAAHKWAVQMVKKLPDKEKLVFHHTPFF